MARLACLVVAARRRARSRRPRRRPRRHHRGARSPDEPRRIGLRRLRGRPRQRRRRCTPARPTCRACPASVNKLYTTSTALLRYGAEGQLTHRRCSATALPDETGVDHRQRRTCAAAATRVRHAPSARGSPSMLAESGLDARHRPRDRRRVALRRLRGGPDSELPHLERGRPAQRAVVQPRPAPRQPHPYFQAQPAVLRGAGVPSASSSARREGAAGTARAGVAPAGAATLGDWASPSGCRRSIRQTNQPSDNYMAETLLKDLGADFGGAGTTAAGTRGRARATPPSFGAHPTMVDGSGLSRQNRTTPHDVVRLLDRARRDRLRRPDADLARRRGRKRHAVRPHARTRRPGPLPRQDRHAATTCRTSRATARRAPARRVAFAFLMNGVSVYTAHPLQDRMTGVLARYRP